jgi:16S rRNA (uracil1498-N3)-methyltransferase
MAGNLGVHVRIERAVTPAAEPPVRVTLCAGILGKDQMDAVMRDATMLGVTAIVPMISAHVTVGKAATRNASAVARWQRVVVSSVKQCGRAVVPEVLPPATFDAVLADAARGDLLICVEPALATDAAASRPERPAAARLLIGPEGGWSPEEVAAARRQGAVTLSLGPRRLRAETAPVVALTALWTGWGW